MLPHRKLNVSKHIQHFIREMSLWQVFWVQWVAQQGYFLMKIWFNTIKFLFFRDNLGKHVMNGLRKGKHRKLNWFSYCFNNDGTTYVDIKWIELKIHQEWNEMSAILFIFSRISFASHSFMFCWSLLSCVIINFEIVLFHTGL